jgi:hypothetical protein
MYSGTSGTGLAGGREKAIRFFLNWWVDSEIAQRDFLGRSYIRFFLTTTPPAEAAGTPPKQGGELFLITTDLKQMKELFS